MKTMERNILTLYGVILRPRTHRSAASMSMPNAAMVAQRVENGRRRGLQAVEHVAQPVEEQRREKRGRGEEHRQPERLEDADARLRRLLGHVVRLSSRRRDGRGGAAGLGP